MGCRASFSPAEEPGRPHVLHVGNMQVDRVHVVTHEDSASRWARGEHQCARRDLILVLLRKACGQLVPR